MLLIERMAKILDGMFYRRFNLMVEHGHGH